MADNSIPQLRNVNPTFRSQQSNDDQNKDLKANIRESRWIQPEQWQLPEIQEKFKGVILSLFLIMYQIAIVFMFQDDVDFSEIHGLLQQLGIKVQRFELNKILSTHDRNKDGRMSKEEFEEVRYNQSRSTSFIVCS